MTDTSVERAPRNSATPAEVNEETQSGAAIYIIGSALALIFTVTSSWIWLFTAFYHVGARP